MRVAHILRKYDPAEWGGTETALHRLCVGLHQGGVGSVVFCPSLPDAGGRDPLAEIGCVVKRYQACLPVWGISAERRRQMVAVGGNLMSFDLIRALWREPDLAVIHAHATGRIGAIGRMVARWRGLPFLFTTHGGVYDLAGAPAAAHRPPEPAGWEWGKVCGALLRTRRLLAESDAVVACNEREAGLIRAHHPGQRVVTQPHGVVAATYEADHQAEARAAFPQVTGRYVLLALGRIDEVKNQAWLVEQMPALVRKDPRVLLVLAGASTDQAYTDTLVRRIEQLGLGSHVLLTGGLPPGDPRLVGLLQEARVVVLPSVSETFGLVILEAWAAGTPVISSRTTGAAGLIEHGETGLLFDLEQPASFHASLAVLRADPALVVRLVACSRRRVLVDFDARVLANRMRRLYDNLVEEKHALRHPA